VNTKNFKTTSFQKSMCSIFCLIHTHANTIPPTHTHTHTHTLKYTRPHTDTDCTFPILDISTNIAAFMIWCEESVEPYFVTLFFNEITVTDCVFSIGFSAKLTKCIPTIFLLPTLFLSLSHSLCRSLSVLNCLCVCMLVSVCVAHIL